MSFETTSNVGFTGVLEINERSVETGEVVSKFKQNNIFLDAGRNSVIDLLLNDDATRPKKIQTIVLGNDTGVSTDVLAPTPPTVATTHSDQNIVYAVPVSSVSITRPNQNQIQITASVDGAEVMSNYPAEPNVIYTSASVRLMDENFTPTVHNGTAIAYRRFAARTISELISVEVIWTLTIE